MKCPSHRPAPNHDIPDILWCICNMREFLEGLGRPGGSWTGGRQASQDSSLLDFKRAARESAWPAARSPATWSPPPKHIVISAYPSSNHRPGRILRDFARVALAREEVWNVVVRSCLASAEIRRGAHCRFGRRILRPVSGKAALASADTIRQAAARMIAPWTA